MEAAAGASTAALSPESPLMQFKKKAKTIVIGWGAAFAIFVLVAVVAASSAATAYSNYLTYSTEYSYFTEEQDEALSSYQGFDALATLCYCGAAVSGCVAFAGSMALIGSNLLIAYKQS